MTIALNPTTLVIFSIGTLLGIMLGTVLTYLRMTVEQWGATIVSVKVPKGFGHKSGRSKIAAKDLRAAARIVAAATRACYMAMIGNADPGVLAALNLITVEMDNRGGASTRDDAKALERAALRPVPIEEEVP